VDGGCLLRWVLLHSINILACSRKVPMENTIENAAARLNPQLAAPSEDRHLLSS
jgi:hypothetical protein